MKSTILFISLSFALNASAQSVAQDWTVTDCGTGSSHNLFTYLNNEEVVIMEFGMGCASCSDPALPLIDLRNSYSVSHPGKVKLFYLDYWTGNTCSDVLPAFGIYDYDVIATHCLYQKDYYMVGSPMPGIVIAAGSNHLVIYEKLSFSESDTVEIKDAIDNFFLTVSVKEMRVEDNVTVYPNPAQEFVNVAFDCKNNIESVINLVNTEGKTVKNLYSGCISAGQTHYQFSLSNVPAGTYFVTLGKNSKFSKKIIVK